MSDVIPGVINLRDIGGHPVAGGGVTRSGIAYRSAALRPVSETDLADFAASDIGVVVDFRTDLERAMSGTDQLPTTRPVQEVILPLLQGQLAPPDPTGAKPSAQQVAAIVASLPTLPEMYAGMLAGGGASFAHLARLVAAADPSASTAVLYHCTAGKDRTGVATALLLGAVGVQHDAIVADYAVSQQNLAGPWADAMLAQITALGAPLDDAIVTMVTKTPAEAMVATLQLLDSTYGGAAAYLQAGGLTDDELAQLRETLVAH